MGDLGLGQCANSRPTRRARSLGGLEVMERRTMLSGFLRPVTTPLAVELDANQASITTTTLLQSKTQTGAGSLPVSLTAKVLTTQGRRLVSTGHVRFSVESPSSVVLGTAGLNKLGMATIQTSKLDTAGAAEIQAQFIPSQHQYAGSLGSITVEVGPPQVTAFWISAAHYYGATGTPLTFSVTAFDRAKQPVTDYTGTINVFSPTDHAAQFSTKPYAFTSADQGSHTFVEGVTFHKGGAEKLKVVQISNTRIHGLTTFGIE
jgi:hypothetical protein